MTAEGTAETQPTPERILDKRIKTKGKLRKI
jgi:hypothetical protein